MYGILLSSLCKDLLDLLDLDIRMKFKKVSNEYISEYLLLHGDGMNEDFCDYGPIILIK